jgi:site-specific recombinase XerC
MILARLIRSLGSDRSVDGLDPAELRAWLVEGRTTLAPVSVAGYVRTLRVLGHCLAPEGLAKATALRGLRRPHVPHKVIEPVADDVLRRLLGIASIRDRATVLLMIDTGLRVSEVAGSGSATCGPTGRSRSSARAHASGSCR